MAGQTKRACEGLVMSDYVHHEMFPMGEDKTPYRLLTTDFVSTVDFDGREILKVDSRALSLLADQIEKFKPESIWSRSAYMGFGAIQSGFKGKLIHIFPTTARMDTLGIFINRAASSPIRRFKRMLFWPWCYRTDRHIEIQLIKTFRRVIVS